jgi:hypothetical protein
MPRSLATAGQKIDGSPKRQLKSTHRRKHQSQKNYLPLAVVFTKEDQIPSIYQLASAPGVQALASKVNGFDVRQVATLLALAGTASLSRRNR